MWPVSGFLTATVVCVDTAPNTNSQPLVTLCMVQSTLTNRNSIQVEIKSILKLGYLCYYSVQNILSSSLLSKN